MRTDVDNADSGLPVITILVLIGVVVLLAVAAYVFIVELFAFGARPGLAPTGTVLNVWIVATMDKAMLHAPILQGWGTEFLRWQTESGDNRGPQAVWRWYATWLSVIMIGSGILMLLAKRFVETTNDETTVMHLKGDTATAFRAKGFRG